MTRSLLAVIAVSWLVSLAWACGGGSNGGGAGGSTSGTGGTGGYGGDGCEYESCASCNGPELCPSTVPTAGADCDSGDPVCGGFDCKFQVPIGTATVQVVASCFETWDVAFDSAYQATCSAYGTEAACSADLGCRWANPDSMLSIKHIGCYVFRSCSIPLEECDCAPFQGSLDPAIGTCVD